MLKLSPTAFANSMAILTAAFYLLFYLINLIAPGLFRFLFNAQFLGADVASLLPIRGGLLSVRPRKPRMNEKRRRCYHGTFAYHQYAWFGGPHPCGPSILHGQGRGRSRAQAGDCAGRRRFGSGA